MIQVIREQPCYVAGPVVPTDLVNQAEALDASRAAVREENLIVPRRDPMIELFDEHMAADAKVLDEDEEAGAKKVPYIQTGVDYFSLALRYAWLAASDQTGARGWLTCLQGEIQEHRRRASVS